MTAACRQAPDTAGRMFVELTSDALDSDTYSRERVSRWVAGLLLGDIGVGSIVEAMANGGLYSDTRVTAGSRSPETYFCRMEVPTGDRPIKIGASRQPTQRCLELVVGSPYPITLLVDFPGVLLPEYYVHEAFAAERLRGEWFRPSPRLLAFVELLQRIRSNPETATETATRGVR